MATNNPFFFQVHHIIPLETFSDYGDDLQRIFGVKNAAQALQSYNNRVALPTSNAGLEAIKGMGLDKSVPMGKTVHSGSHPAYTKAVNDKIKDIIDNVPAEHQKAAMVDLQSVLKNMLLDGDPPLKSDKQAILDHLNDHTLTTEAYMSALASYLDNHDRPLALYSDRHSIFSVNTKG